MLKGLLHVYYGYGKGKTTAALGLALRASGHGRQVVLVQFLKDMKSGELKQLALLPNITVLRGKPCRKMFISDMNEEQKSEIKALHDANLAKAVALAENKQCDLLILDEALDAYQLGMLDEAMLAALVDHKPAELELVITGHKPDDWIVRQADYVTEMVKVKHPFDSGVKARKGIEF